MREIHIRTTWFAMTTVEVADDWEAPDESAFELGVDINGDPIADQVTTQGAALTDWELA